MTGATSGAVACFSGTRAVGDQHRAPFYVGLSGYFFAAGRLRTPGKLGQATAGREYSAHKVEFYSPPYPSNHFRCAFPGHFTLANGSVPSERAIPNSYFIEGHALQAFIGGSWIVVTGSFGGGQSVVIDPATNEVGVLGDDIVFPHNVPPNTRMAIVTCLHVNTDDNVGVSVRDRVGTYEGARASASSQIAHLKNTGPLGRPHDRIGGRLFAPSFIVAKPFLGLDRPVFWVNGDSIGWGANSNENILVGTGYGGFGFIDLALEDDTRSRRTPFYNSCVPGVGAGEQQYRSAWSRKLDLIKLVPNRPYTHIITQHYGNGPSGDYETVFKPSMKAYFSLLKSESQSWGNPASPIFQTRPIPFPGSTDWVTSLAGESPSMSPYPAAVRWRFDADLLAGDVYTDIRGTIDTNRDYAFDQFANRDKIAIIPFSTTLAANFASGNAAISLADPVAVGDMVVVDPGGTNQARHVIEVVGSPYTAMLESPINRSYGSGVNVRISYVGDSMGVHPATPGHVLISRSVIDWKAVMFSELPRDR